MPPNTEESIKKIVSSLKDGIPIAPISPREPKLPTLPKCPDGIATCLQTSGSMGSPKFALHTLENHLTNANFSNADLTLTPNDGWLLSLPLNHIGGLAILIRCSLAGANIILPDGPKELVTHLSFVPTQLKRFLEKPSPYPNLKAILVGGAPIPLKLCIEAYEKGLPLYLTYGMTEMSSQIATQKFHPTTGITFGFPLPHREIKITEEGEILVRGKTLFQGYLGQKSPFVEGWFPTKDLGQMTPNGLRVVGRKDRMIISGGENIHLEEIEIALMNLPEVTSVKVASREDEEFGKRPVAQIDLNTPLSKEEIRERLSQTLPRYKIPNISDMVLTSGTHFGKGQ